MVTRRKQHSSQRPVQQGPAVTASRPNKIGASTPYHFRGRKPTPYGGLLPVVGRALIWEPGYALCIKFYALAVTHWNHVTSERGFDDADSGREGKPDTEKAKGQLPSYHLTTTANPLRTQPHSQSESVHNSGYTMVSAVFRVRSTLG